MKSKNIALIAIFGALSALLMYFTFPLPFMPPFMDFDLCGIPEMIGGFTLGPAAAFFIIMVKLILKLPTIIIAITPINFNLSQK